MPRIRGSWKDWGLKCQWHLPSWHAYVSSLWLKVPGSPWENPFGSSSCNQSAAVTWLPCPSTETIRITSHIPAFFQQSFVVCSICTPFTCPKVIALPVSTLMFTAGTHPTVQFYVRVIGVYTILYPCLITISPWQTSLCLSDLVLWNEQRPSAERCYQCCGARHFISEPANSALLCLQ